MCEWKYPTVFRSLFSTESKKGVYGLGFVSRVTRYAIHVTLCDIHCQRQPLRLLAVAFVFNVLSLSESHFAFKIRLRSVCSSLHYICNIVHLDTQHGWRWCVSPSVLRDVLTRFLVQAGSSSSQCSWLQDYCSPWFSS